MELAGGLSLSCQGVKCGWTVHTPPETQEAGRSAELKEATTVMKHVHRRSGGGATSRLQLPAADISQPSAVTVACLITMEVQSTRFSGDRKSPESGHAAVCSTLKERPEQPQSSGNHSRQDGKHAANRPKVQQQMETVQPVAALKTQRSEDENQE